MPATSRNTRQQIRRSIGQRTGSIWMDAGEPYSNPSETSPTAAKIIDNNLAYGSENEHRGKWAWVTDSNSSNELRRVISSSPDERSITVAVPFSRTPDTGWTYELWDNDFSPATVHSYINDAINEMTRKGVIHTSADSFHTGGGINTFGVDSSWLGVSKVEYRESFLGVTLAAMDEAGDSLTANTTVELDSADYVEGIGAMKLTVAAGESANTAIANSSFAAIDIRGYDQLEFFYKTGGSVTSSNFKIQLMQTSSAQVEISVPASGGDSWTYHVASISAPESNSGITAVQVSTGSSDGGAATVWLDGVKVSRKNTGQFITVPRDFWSLEQSEREVRLGREVRLPSAMLRIHGVRNPNSLDTDTAICEIDPAYIISYVQGMRLLMKSDPNAGRRDAAGLNANTFLQLAQLQRSRISMPSNVRWMDD